MAVPKRRTSHARSSRRRRHLRPVRLALTTCPKCQQRILPHVACQNCGTYQGRTVIDVLAKLAKRERRAKTQQLAAQAKQAPQLT